MVPLIVSDITHAPSAGFNLALGMVGAAMSIGATLSTTLAGFVTEHLGAHIAYIWLAVAAGAGCALVLLVLPETGGNRPTRRRETSRRSRENRRNTLSTEPNLASTHDALIPAGKVNGTGVFNPVGEKLDSSTT